MKKRVLLNFNFPFAEAKKLEEVSVLVAKTKTQIVREGTIKECRRLLKEKKDFKC